MIQFNQHGDTSIATVETNTLDASNSEKFKQSLSKVAGSNQQVLLDLSIVNFIDSSGLGALLSIQRLLTSNGGDLKLCSLTRQAKSLFELVRLNGVFEIYSDIEEAKRALA